MKECRRMKDSTSSLTKSECWGAVFGPRKEVLCVCESISAEQKGLSPGHPLCLWEILVLCCTVIRKMTGQQVRLDQGSIVESGPREARLPGGEPQLRDLRSEQVRNLDCDPPQGAGPTRFPLPTKTLRNSDLFRMQNACVQRCSSVSRRVGYYRTL